MKLLQRIVWHTLEWPIAMVWALFAWLVQSTAHVEIEGCEPDGAAVYINWHRYQSFLIPFHGRRRRWMLVSPAPQLAPVARFCRLMGLNLVRGASGDRGNEAREEMKTLLRRGQSVVLAVDGPRGPAFQAKKGCIEVAQSAGVPIVPVSYSCSRAHEFKWRWDRTLMPLPFSTIRVKCGSVIVPSGNEAQALAAIEAQLNALESAV